MHRFSFVSLINYKAKKFLVRKVVLPEVCFRGRFLLSNRKPFALTSTRPWTSLGEIGNYTKYIFPTISLLSFICSNTKLFYQLMGGGDVFIYACVDSATKHLPRHQLNRCQNLWRSAYWLWVWQHCICQNYIEYIHIQTNTAFIVSKKDWNISSKG